jgi:hypothetical protein
LPRAEARTLFAPREWQEEEEEKKKIVNTNPIKMDKITKQYLKEVQKLNSIISHSRIIITSFENDQVKDN